VTQLMFWSRTRGMGPSEARLASSQVLLEEGHEAVKGQLGLFCGGVCLPHLCTSKCSTRVQYSPSQCSTDVSNARVASRSRNRYIKHLC
jgi:hypothetical protein